MTGFVQHEFLNLLVSKTSCQDPSLIGHSEGAVKGPKYQNAHLAGMVTWVPTHRAAPAGRGRRPVCSSSSKHLLYDTVLYTSNITLSTFVIMVSHLKLPSITPIRDDSYLDFFRRCFCIMIFLNQPGLDPVSVNGNRHLPLLQKHPASRPALSFPLPPQTPLEESSW